MRKKTILLTGIALLILATGGGAIWLASAPIMPPLHTVVQAIPDDRIPR